MALGLPVVTTDVAGAKELVLDGQTGYVRSQGDVEGMAAAIIALVENESLRKGMSHAGRERIEREFSFSTRMERIEALYQRILGVQGYAAVATESAEITG